MQCISKWLHPIYLLPQKVNLREDKRVTVRLLVNNSDTEDPDNDHDDVHDDLHE